jgi:hypothetical protein
MQRPEIGIDGLESNRLSQAVAEETAADKKKKEYFKKLVEIKVQYTKVDQLTGEAPISFDSSKFLGTLLDLDDFGFAEGVLDWGTRRQRTIATYQGNIVWIEWKDIPASGKLLAASKRVENRIGLLIDLLCYEKPKGFRAPPCLGYVKAVDRDNGARFGMVFGKSLKAGAKSELLTLRELLGQIPKPSLSARISLCAVLARCVYSFHSVNWLHKGLRGDNIIFFLSPSERLDLSSPYVSGFELSRPSIVDKMTEKPNGYSPSEDQSLQSSRTLEWRVSSSCCSTGAPM